MKSRKGSETANGDTPVPSGSFRSLIVRVFAGGVKSMCFLGSKSSVLSGFIDSASRTGSMCGYVLPMSDTTSVVAMPVRYGETSGFLGLNDAVSKS